MAINNSTTPTTTGWVGWVYFAAFMILFIGILQLITGLTALLNKAFYILEDDTLVVLDIATWGWIHLILGIVLICTSIALFNGSGWARTIAVVLVTVNFIAQFAFIGVYPLWSSIILILDLLIIYALTVHGGELQHNS